MLPKPTTGRCRPARPTRRRASPAIAALALATAIIALDSSFAPAQTADGPAAWRVECTGDGKVLDCRAVQQIFQRDARQQLAPLATVLVRYTPDVKAAAMSIQLPLGLNLTEPILIRVDNGAPERQPIQICNNAGCFVNMTVNDKLLAAMRTGTELKLTVQDASKKPVEVALPLLGFGVAYDKAK